MCAVHAVCTRAWDRVFSAIKSAALVCAETAVSYTMVHILWLSAMQVSFFDICGVLWISIKCILFIIIVVVVIITIGIAILTIFYFLFISIS